MYCKQYYIAPKYLSQITTISLYMDWWLANLQKSCAGKSDYHYWCPGRVGSSVVKKPRNSSTISRQPTRTNPQGFLISRGEKDKIPSDTVCANDECPLENSEQDRLLPWVVPQNPPDQYQRHFIEQTLSSFLPTSKLYIHTSNTCDIVYATYVCVWTIIGRRWQDGITA